MQAKIAELPSIQSCYFQVFILVKHFQLLQRSCVYCFVTVHLLITLAIFNFLNGIERIVLHAVVIFSFFTMYINFGHKDEECLRPGEVSDMTFLDKMEKTIGEHAHFVR